jgi:SAM-dependent methyltransferase
VRTEKLYSQPYDNPAVVKLYEDNYIHHTAAKDHVLHEIKSIQNIEKEYDYKSWCDVACGTAYHLRKAKTDLAKCGIDRSSTMIEQHKEDTEYQIEYILCDFLDWKSDRKFDLVTNFWFGYSHQPTLKLVLEFFDKLVSHTNTGGSILLSLHNQWKLFDKYPHSTDIEGWEEGKFLFDAIQWSYEEPSTGDVYECIVPHTQLIANRLSPYFNKLVYLDYPTYSAGKELLLLQGKK